MIPSPTKLALLTGIVLLASSPSGSSPTRYDQRQEGEVNFRANAEDVIVVAAPPREYFANGLAWLGSNFIRHNPNRIPSRAPSKHGFVQTEKSPYKVDLGKSSATLIKLQSPVIEEVKLYKIRDLDRDDSKILMGDSDSDSKTVKKDLKGNGEDVAEEGGTAAVAAVSAAATTTTAETEAPTTEGKAAGLKVVGAGSVMGAEDCGPKARRNSDGVCVYE